MSANGWPANGSNPLIEQSQSPTIHYRLPSWDQSDAGAGTPFLDVLKSIQEAETRSQIKARAKHARNGQKLLRRYHGLDYQPCCAEHIPKSRPPSQHRSYRSSSRSSNTLGNNPRDGSHGMLVDIDDPSIKIVDRDHHDAIGPEIDDHGVQSYEEDSRNEQPYDNSLHDEDPGKLEPEAPEAKENTVALIVTINLRKRSASI